MRGTVTSELEIVRETVRNAVYLRLKGLQDPLLFQYVIANLKPGLTAALDGVVWNMYLSVLHDT
jgi:hypothetical protein